MAIDSNTQLAFKSADSLFADVKRFLKSYDSANLIDEGEFPSYIPQVLRLLGRGVMKDSEAIIKVNSKIIELPQDFEYIYEAYRCKDNTQRKVKRTYEQGGAVLYNDITRDIIYKDSNNCLLTCWQKNSQILERVTIKQMVADSECIINFSYPTRLYLTNKSISTLSPSEFSLANAGEHAAVIDGNKLHINFEDDWIYLKYYGFPYDEYGVPMIPDIESVYQALKWYIIYQVSLSWWWNNEVPDIQNRWQEAEMQYNQWL